MDTTLSTLSVLHPIIFPVIKHYLADRKDDWQAWQGINTYYFDFKSESNEYGICQELVELGIPFNMSTDTDRNMDGEDQYYRFSEIGELIKKTVNQRDRDPDLNVLEQLKYDHLGLIHYINNFSKSVADPSWLNQIQNGRIYRARLLIQGNNNG